MPSFNDYFLYVSYFPQLVAGPILRPEEFFDRNSKPILNQNHNLIKMVSVDYATDYSQTLHS